ncbi:MAG: hypothetical protein JNM22_21605, partial [Saprospiraceae bacterium]|nr:hypothetical protein [Saprospiraceae bacterium]
MKKMLQVTEKQFFVVALLLLSSIAAVQAQTFPTPGFTLPAGKTICITYEVEVNANVCPNNSAPGSDISNQSNVS